MIGSTDRVALLLAPLRSHEKRILLIQQGQGTPVNLLLGGQTPPFEETLPPGEGSHLRKRSLGGKLLEGFLEEQAVDCTDNFL